LVDSYTHIHTGNDHNLRTIQLVQAQNRVSEDSAVKYSRGRAYICNKIRRY
jgi:hypothetical protein